MAMKCIFNRYEISSVYGASSKIPAAESGSRRVLAAVSFVQLSLVLAKWPLWHLHHHLFCFSLFHFMPDSYANGLQGAQPKDESYECS